MMDDSSLPPGSSVSSPSRSTDVMILQGGEAKDGVGVPQVRVGGGHEQTEGDGDPHWKHGSDLEDLESRKPEPPSSEPALPPCEGRASTSSSLGALMDHQYGSGSWMMVQNQNQNQMAIDHQSLHPQYQQQQQQQTPPPQQQQQSLASHFNLIPLVERLAEVTENGSRDQHSDALVSELTNHFEKCQQLLNSISGLIDTKSATVEGQKAKLEESLQQLNERRDLISNYRSSIEELINSANR